MLVNFTGQTRDVMTLAHELGHGMHMYLSAEAQGITGLYTPLTTAEMASTFGEMLTFTDLMAKEPDPAARLAMLADKIEDSFATIFRQIAMNRFEDGAAHRPPQPKANFRPSASAKSGWRRSAPCSRAA